MFDFICMYSLANSVATINKSRLRSLQTGQNSLGNSNVLLSSNQPVVGLDNNRPKPIVSTATLDTSVQTIIDKMQNGLEVSAVLGRTI
jgi:hypothetical protein